MGTLQMKRVKGAEMGAAYQNEGATTVSHNIRCAVSVPTVFALS